MLWLAIFVMLFPFLVSPLYVCVWSVSSFLFPDCPWIPGLLTALHDGIVHVLWIFLFQIGWSQLYIKSSTFQDSPTIDLYFWKATSCQKPRDCDHLVLQVFLYSFMKTHADHNPKQVIMLMNICLDPIRLCFPPYNDDFKHNTVTDPHMTRTTTAS